MEEHNSSINVTMRPASRGKCLVTLSTYKERQEALKRTTIMEDDVNHRTNPSVNGVNGVLSNNAHEKILTVNDGVQNGLHMHIPPPPPQFANSPPKVNQPPASTYMNLQQKFNTKTITQPLHTGNHSNGIPRPPSSPVPDYDNVQMRTNIPTAPTTNVTSSSLETTTTVSPTNAAINNGNRRTMRLGTVTIGEYEHHQQRKEPGKFDFISTQRRSNKHEDVQDSSNSLRSELQNTLTRANLRKSNGHEQLAHQNNCSYENLEFKTGTNVGNLARQLQGTSLATTTPVVMRNGSGILKNGGSRATTTGSVAGANFIKTTEKSITFGN